MRAVLAVEPNPKPKIDLRCCNFSCAAARLGRLVSSGCDEDFVILSRMFAFEDRLLKEKKLLRFCVGERDRVVVDEDNFSRLLLDCVEEMESFLLLLSDGVGDKDLLSGGGGDMAPFLVLFLRESPTFRCKRGNFFHGFASDPAGRCLTFPGESNSLKTEFVSDLELKDSTDCLLIARD